MIQVSYSKIKFLETGLLSKEINEEIINDAKRFGTKLHSALEKDLKGISREKESKKIEKLVSQGLEVVTKLSGKKKKYPLHIEENYEIKIEVEGKECKILARIDLWWINTKTNTLHIVEHKSSTNPFLAGHNHKTAIHDTQLLLYAWILSKVLDFKGRFQGHFIYYPTKSGKVFPVSAGRIWRLRDLEKELNNFKKKCNYFQKHLQLDSMCGIINISDGESALSDIEKKESQKEEPKMATKSNRPSIPQEYQEIQIPTFEEFQVLIDKELREVGWVSVERLKKAADLCDKNIYEMLISPYVEEKRGFGKVIVLVDPKSKEYKKKIHKPTILVGAQVVNPDGNSTYSCKSLLVELEEKIEETCKYLKIEDISDPIDFSGYVDLAKMVKKDGIFSESQFLYIDENWEGWRFLEPSLVLRGYCIIRAYTRPVPVLVPAKSLEVK
jgi:hypothetical protein